MFCIAQNTFGTAPVVYCLPHTYKPYLDTNHQLYSCPLHLQSGMSEVEFKWKWTNSQLGTPNCLLFPSDFPTQFGKSWKRRCKSNPA